MAAIAVILLLAPATALAQQDTGADNKANPYGNNAESSAGLCLEGLLEVACAKSESSTSDSEASSSSEATPLQILVVPVNEKTCAAVGADQTGVVKDEKPFTSTGAVQILDSRCKASAVQQNNAASEAETVLLSASGDDFSVDVARSRAENKTTSGEARSEAEFVLVMGEIDGVGEATLLQCRSKTNANRGNPDGRTRTTGTLIDINGNRFEDPGLCQLVVNAEANWAA